MSEYRLDQHQNIVRDSDGGTIPPDPDNRDYAAYLQWVHEGNVADPYTPPASTEADYVAAVVQLLDATVKPEPHNYDSILSACSYDNDPNPRFAADAAACKAWRSAVWTQAYADLAAVMAGTMAQPTVEAFIASLPQLTWPQV